MLIEIFVLIFVCPYHVFFMACRDRYWEALPDQPLLWISVLMYLGTTVFAAIMAHRLEFRKYRLFFATNTWTVLLGCLFSWGLYYYFFAHNWGRIASGKAVRRDCAVPARRYGVFCMYAAGMVWTLFIQFTGGAAIPGIVLPRWRHNEYEAMSFLKQYAKAQAEFREKNYGGDAAYCDEYRRLYYGKDGLGRRLELVPREMADMPVAFSAGERETAVRRSLRPGDIGYVFLEDPYVAGNSLWSERFGLVAYPTLPGRSGRHVFWVGAEGKVLFRYGGGKTPLGVEESPLHPDGRKLWEGL